MRVIGPSTKAIVFALDLCATSQDRGVAQDEWRDSVKLHLTSEPH